MFARLLPPNLRRAAAGLLSDLQSLPQRIKDPARRGDPWQFLHNVGGGDFQAVGISLRDVLIKHAGLRPTDRVLDIGCGTGRVTTPLATYLGADGGYVGFDVGRHAIMSCRRRFAHQRPDFVFMHADVRNAVYNKNGATEEAAYVFPCADASIDLAFATSVFTHMKIGSVQHYLREIARVLKPGGRVAFTAYIIDDDTRQALAAGRAAMAFAPWRERAWVIDPAYPERAIAHEVESLRDAVAAAGLSTPSAPLRGAWSPPATYESWQDLWVAVKQ